MGGRGAPFLLLETWHRKLCKSLRYGVMTATFALILTKLGCFKAWAITDNLLFFNFLRGKRNFKDKKMMIKSKGSEIYKCHPERKPAVFCGCFFQNKRCCREMDIGYHPSLCCPNVHGCDTSKAKIRQEMCSADYPCVLMSNFRLLSAQHEALTLIQFHDGCDFSWVPSRNTEKVGRSLSNHLPITKLGGSCGKHLLQTIVTFTSPGRSRVETESHKMGREKLPLQRLKHRNCDPWRFRRCTHFKVFLEGCT